MDADYIEAIRWLNVQTRGGAPRGLSRVRELLAALGHPEGKFAAAHVLGTNGKGSVVAYLEAALRQASRAYGATTSPHVLDFRERIRTHQGLIAENQVTEFCDWARSRSFQQPPAFFDLATAMAFQHFAQRGVELAVVEAGVGGLLDATNTLEDVRVSVITNVEEDHLEALGGSIITIAQEKAGAIREGVPVVTAATGQGLSVIRQTAELKGAPLFVMSEERDLFELPAAPNLKGTFQLENARLAAAALRILGFSGAAISQALASATHPGRMQEVSIGGMRVVLDGGHNKAAARALAQEFERYHLVFGAFPRKDYQGMLQVLLPKALSVTYTSAGEGSLGKQELCQVAGGDFYQDQMEGLEACLSRAQQDNEPALVTGSLYLVGELLRRLGQQVA